MAAEVFRFMTIRPAQESSRRDNNLIDLTGIETGLLRTLGDARARDARDEMEKLARAFIAGGDHIDSRGKLDGKFLAYHDALAGLPDEKFLKAARDLHVQMLGEPAAYLDRDEFRGLLRSLVDSLAAAALVPDVSAANRSLLVGIARAVGLTMRLARGGEDASYARADHLAQGILLPETIFPLPPRKQDLSGHQAEEEERRKREEADRKTLDGLSDELGRNRRAIDEILATYEKLSFKPAKALSIFTPSAEDPTGPGGFVLSDREAEALSPETKKIARDIGFEGPIDVARTTSLIEKRSSAIVDTLHKNRNASRYMTSIGGRLVPSEAVLGGAIGLFEAGGNSAARPGPCPPTPPAAGSDDVTIPLWTTHGEARALGFAELMIVEQELLRYELGEIAHIENVLIGELRQRDFRTSNTTEELVETETETTDEKSKDLVSTERFELQSETERVISESSGIQTGVTVNASYGPSVDVSANFGYTSSTAKESSTRASSNFARETTIKAASKVQKRTLERRLRRTIGVVEESNRHSFRNRESDAENISGVYRFVDKIYQAQIVNYGKRFMLEFVVPEPAAFLRYALMRQPAEGISQVKPDEPGYCINGVFVPLQPQDITRDNYLFWASKYLAEDVTPPPSSTQIISGVATNDAPGSKSQFTEDIYNAQELKELKIPDGYKPTRAIVSAEGWNVAKQGSHPAHLVLQIQKDIVEIANQGVVQILLESDVTDKVPIAIVTKNYERYAIIANVFCVITSAKFEEWQLATYASIMTAYNELKNRYDTALEALRMKASFQQISGTNPLANREREKVELKKGCLALLTGQNFEQFDSVRRNVAPHGFPEIAFADANAEGRYIQFFENAFEWVNMTYIFYPYFWGRKSDWVTISQIADTDPLYERFLQAGAARVQVPVRPGFEIAVANYLGIKTLWMGDGTLVTAEDEHVPEHLHVSILDELKEQLGNQDVEGKGRLALEKDSVAVTGTDTGFTADDERRRIVIHGDTYVIDAVASPTEVRLSSPYAGASETGVRYSLGARLVGEAWEVKLPTNLVIIEKDGQSLLEA